MTLLIYTATFLPYRTAFFDDDPDGLFEFETLIDVLFFLDVYMNFVVAYIDKNTGFIEVNPRKIAKNYITSWFLLDLSACIPFQVLTP
jgi:potassium channel